MLRWLGTHPAPDGYPSVWVPSKRRLGAGWALVEAGWGLAERWLSAGWALAGRWLGAEAALIRLAGLTELDELAGLASRYALYS